MKHTKKEKSRINSRQRVWPYIPMSEARGFTTTFGKKFLKMSKIFLFFLTLSNLWVMKTFILILLTFFSFYTLKIPFALGGQKQEHQLHERCYNNFISRDFKKIGPWGKNFLASAKVVEIRNCLSKKIDLSKVCPNFKKFRVEKKKKYWIYFFASIAHVESTCRKKFGLVKGVNGRAVGLLQMENSLKQRKAAGRNPKFCFTKISPKRNKTVVFSNVFQFRCGLSIFKKLYCRENSDKTNKTIGETHRGHWLELNKENGKIVQLIKKFPGCFSLK